MLVIVQWFKAQDLSYLPPFWCCQRGNKCSAGGYTCPGKNHISHKGNTLTGINSIITVIGDPLKLNKFHISTKFHVRKFLQSSGINSIITQAPGLIKTSFIVGWHALNQKFKNWIKSWVSMRALSMNFTVKKNMCSAGDYTWLGIKQKAIPVNIISKLLKLEARLKLHSL